eukprot:COSAG06_NODE_29022_length_563_cov_6.480603_1_plen_48_part_01
MRVASEETGLQARREASKNGGRCCCWVIRLLAEVRRQVETLDEVSMAD